MLPSVRFGKALKISGATRKLKEQSIDPYLKAVVLIWHALITISWRIIKTGDRTAVNSRLVGSSSFRHRRNLNIKYRPIIAVLHIALSTAGRNMEYRYMRMSTMMQKYVLRASLTKSGDRITSQGVVAGKSPAHRHITLINVMVTHTKNMNNWKQTQQNTINIIVFNNIPWLSPYTKEG